MNKYKKEPVGYVCISYPDFKRREDDDELQLQQLKDGTENIFSNVINQKEETTSCFRHPPKFML